METGRMGSSNSKAILKAPFLNRLIWFDPLRVPSGKITTDYPFFRFFLAASMLWMADLAEVRSMNM